jgi:hypothetical protein
MSKLRTILVGTALAGALAAGIAAAPAQAATASTAGTASAASQAQFSRHYYKGYYYFDNGRYYFDLNAWDRDRDQESTSVDFWYHDDKGWHDHRFNTGGHDEWKFSVGARGGFDGFRVRIGEGNSRDFDWNNYYRHSF